MPLPTCKSSFFGGTRKFIVSTSRDQRDRPPGWTLPDSSFSFLCACPRRHPRAHTASRPRVLRSGLQMRDPWVDARRGHRSRRRSCHGTDTAFPAPGLSLPKCCSLIIGKGWGPVQARRRGLMLQGRGEASRGTTAAPSSAPSAPSAWLSLTVPCPGLPGLAVVPTGPGLWFSSQPGTKPGPQAPPHPNHLSFLLICMSLRRLD